MATYVFVLMTVIFTSCSLEEPAALKLQVKLEPPIAPTVEHSFFSLLSSNFTSFNDLNCFSVNVRGGSNPSEAACNGQIQSGAFDGPFAGITTTFEPLVALDDGLIFDAYASKGGGCSGGGVSALNSAESIFKIGSVVANLGSGTATNVNIPVALDYTQAISCSTTPFPLVEDQFNYTSADLTGTSNWSVISGGFCSGGQNFPVAANSLDITTITNGANCAVWGQTFDFSSQPFTRIQVSVTSAATPGAASMLIALGITAGGTDTSVGYGCDFAYTSAAISNDFIMTVYKLLNGFGANTVSSTTSGPTGALPTSTPTFQCDIQQDANGTYRVVGSILDSNGNQLFTPQVATGLAAISALNRAYLRVDPVGLNTFSSGTLDNYKVFQSNTRQY